MTRHSPGFEEQPISVPARLGWNPRRRMAREDEEEEGVVGVGVGGGKLRRSHPCSEAMMI